METVRSHEHGQALVIDALRQTTASRHARIEASMQWGGPITLAHYRRVLLAFARFLPAWESQVLAALPTQQHDWFSRRSRLPLLLQDLAALRLVADMPQALPIDLPSPAATFGSLYVMEGSALGGQLIARQLAQQHGLGVETGTAYFTGWDERTGALWREFRQLLEDEVPASNPPAVQHACRAARQTFDALAATFEATSDEPASD